MKLFAKTREEIWGSLARPWDLVVVGGGITGAGILREAAQQGYSALLLEAHDFAWGTSSRSSKLVHGGLRYLGEGKLHLTFESVRERDRLVASVPGLVDPLEFVLATYRGMRPGRLEFALGLALYDALAGRWAHRQLTPEELRRRAPGLDGGPLSGGFLYSDAGTDDARLVLRILSEGVAVGGTALNYAPAEGLLLSRGRAVGVAVRDAVTGRTAEVRARTVVNATGAFSDRLRAGVGARGRMRPLRGSHLVFTSETFPAPQAISFLHPRDHRPVFVIPWEGVTLLGTTDVDHERPLDEEPVMGADEVAYLMEVATERFPSLQLRPEAAIASFSGVRPVVGTGKADPSKESRDHVIWEESGLLTVTGGKLTTFALIARQTMRRLPPPSTSRAVATSPAAPDLTGLPPARARRLAGRYGAAAPELAAAAGDGELEEIPGTRALWAELRWAALHEAVVHLDDLLLRRVRLGLVAKDGGAEFLPRIRNVCQPSLGFTDERWDAEEARYRELCRRAYGVPGRVG